MVPLAVGRSRWLAELAQAVGEAQRLVCEIDSSAGLSSVTLDLCARLEVVRDEVESIRRGRGMRLTLPPADGFPHSEAFEPAVP